MRPATAGLSTDRPLTFRHLTRRDAVSLRVPSTTKSATIKVQYSNSSSVCRNARTAVPSSRQTTHGCSRPTGSSHRASVRSVKTRSATARTFARRVRLAADRSLNRRETSGGGDRWDSGESALDTVRTLLLFVRRIAAVPDRVGQSLVRSQTEYCSVYPDSADPWVGAYRYIATLIRISGRRCRPAVRVLRRRPRRRETRRGLRR